MWMRGCVDAYMRLSAYVALIDVTNAQPYIRAQRADVVRRTVVDTSDQRRLVSMYASTYVDMLM